MSASMKIGRDSLSQGKILFSSLRFGSIKQIRFDYCFCTNYFHSTFCGVKFREELSRESEDIERLVRGLDAQKEEAILRTFSGVAQNFADVFK